MNCTALKPVVQTSKIFKIVNEKKNAEDIELKCVANKIKTEIKQASMLKNIDPVLS